MVTITRIHSDCVGSEVCEKLAELCKRRADQEKIGRKDEALDKKIEKALLFVFALGEWGFEGDFYVEGADNNCVTPSMVNSILNESNKL